MPKRQIEPSLFAADFARLGEEAKRAEDAGADMLHIDIMDGHFVDNLLLGPKAVAAVKRSCKLPLDVHLMIYNPFDFIERFIEAGASSITFHFEATENIEDTIAFLRKCGCRAGLGFNPETAESLTLRFLDQVDLILLMTVNPGFGGQPFLPEVLQKVRFVRDAATKLDLDLDIQVDGGINDETAQQAVEAGANLLVSGTYLYSHPDMASAIRAMRA